MGCGVTCYCQWHFEADGGALSGAADKITTSSELLQPALHISKAVWIGALAGFGQVEPAPIIAQHHNEHPIRSGDGEVQIGRASMLRQIGKCLLEGEEQAVPLLGI